MNYYEGKNIYRLILITLGVVSLGLFLNTPLFRKNQVQGSLPEMAVSDKGESSQTTAQKTVNPFYSLNLKAKSVYVFDIRRDRALYARNENEKLPLASLAKIMAALVLDELPMAKNMEVSFNTEVEHPRERWLLKDLLDFALVKSSNEAARTLAASLGALVLENSEDGGARKIPGAGDSTENFIIAMNMKARTLGLQNTFFLNETGLDLTGNTSGAYGSALEMTRLVRHILEKNPSLLEATMYEKITLTTLNKKSYTVTNTNHDINKMPRVLLSKTGFTDLAGGNLTLVFDAGLDHPAITVVLGSGEEERFTDMNAIIEATFRYLE